MPMVGIGNARSDLAGEFFGHGFKHDAKCTGFGHGLGVILDGSPFVPHAALGLEAAQHIDGLRREADVGHHRDAPLHQEADGLGHAAAAFQFHGAAARLLHDVRGIAEGDGRAFLIGSERHVDYDEGALGAAHHRAAVHDHQLERHRHGALVAVHDHAQAVAHQQEIHERIGNRCGVGMV